MEINNNNFTLFVNLLNKILLNLGHRQTLHSDYGHGTLTILYKCLFGAANISSDCWRQLILLSFVCCIESAKRFFDWEYQFWGFFLFIKSYAMLREAPNIGLLYLFKIYLQTEANDSKLLISASPRSLKYIKLCWKQRDAVYYFSNKKGTRKLGYNQIDNWDNRRTAEKNTPTRQGHTADSHILGWWKLTYEIFGSWVFQSKMMATRLER